jgi:superfamily II DNA or RNA helicase
MSLDHKLELLDMYKKAYEENKDISDNITLGNHQFLPIFDSIMNGGPDRFLLDYATAAGKTIIPIETLKQLRKKKGRAVKALIICPSQTMEDNWDEETLEEYKYMNKDVKVHHIKEKKDTNIPEDANFVVVNYEKLPPKRKNIQKLIEYAKTADLIVVDECHNIKNRTGQTSRGYQYIIEETRDKRLIALSATAVPNSMKDLGMILYTISPEDVDENGEVIRSKDGEITYRYEHYKNQPYSVKNDPEALWEMKETGRVRSFTREDVAWFHNLPEFTEHQPITVTMKDSYAERYLAAIKEPDNLNLGNAVNSLAQISIEAMIDAKETNEFFKDRLDKGYCLNFFSQRRNEKDQEIVIPSALFEKLALKLVAAGAKNIAFIHGSESEEEKKKMISKLKKKGINLMIGTSPEERKKIQEIMAAGELDALVNQQDCTKEGFKEVAGERPVSIIPIVSPFSPGDQIQECGRSWRPGQKGVVEYQEFHPDSVWLRKEIEDYVHAEAEMVGARVKTSWTASLFHKDAYNIRTSKDREIKLMMYNKGYLSGDEDKLNVGSVAGYAKLLSKSRILDMTEMSPEFGTGLRRVSHMVGVPFKTGLMENGEDLGKDYDRKDILTKTPGRLNLVLAEVVEKIKKKENQQRQTWKIADLGSCTSSTFAQARILWQELMKVRGMEVGLDRIVSVDGQEGFIKNATRYMDAKEWCECIVKLTSTSISPLELITVQERLKKEQFMKRLEFLHRNFVDEKFGTKYDTIIASQCLQYNDQSESRDIESIVMNINKALKINRHLLLVLTGNNFKTSYTRDKDVENLETILREYGFSVKQSEHIEGKHITTTPVRGKKTKKKSVAPFHYLHAVKVNEHSSGFAEFDEVPVVYEPYYYVVTGGSKNVPLRATIPKTSVKNIPLATCFMDKNGHEIILGE